MSLDDGRESEAGAAPASDYGATAIGRFLVRLCEVLALVGGAIMLFIMFMTVISIIGRQLYDMPIKGDYEITEILSGVAVFLFFPYTQITGQNLVAEFFTSGLPDRARTWIEAVHALIFAVVAAFLSWRIFEGLLEKFDTGEKTILIDLPLWWSYLFATAACAVLALVCLWGVARHWSGKHT